MDDLKNITALPARLTAIFRRRNRRARIVQLPPDPEAAEQARQQARQDYPGETLIFVSARAD